MSFLRVYKGPETKIYYDVCDELGIISQDDFSHYYRQLAPAELVRGELIEEQHTSGYLRADGTFLPQAAAKLRQWVTRLHNHPSVCLFTAGNEIGWESDPTREKQQAAFLNAFYDFVKAQDRQQRPVTPSSGLTVWMWHTPVKADYYDYHNYNDSDYGWAFAVEGNRWSWDNLQRIYGPIEKPVINGECIGYSSLWTRPDISALWREGRLDQAGYVTWAQALAKNPRFEDIGSIWDYATRGRLVRWKGVRAAVNRDAAAQNRMALTRDVVRVFRRDMPQLQGFVILANTPEQFGFPRNEGADFTEAELAADAQQCLANIDLRTFREILAPQFATLNMCDRHQFAGRPFRATVHLLNFRYRSPEPKLTVEVALRGPVGEYLQLQRLDFRDVAEQARLSREIELPLQPALATGDYLIEVTLLRGADRTEPGPAGAVRALPGGRGQAPRRHGDRRAL